MNDKVLECEKIESYINEIDGKIVTEFPTSIPALNAAKPVLQKFAGWKKNLKECGSYSKMPKNAKAYIEFIEEFTNTPVGIVSVGSERVETYMRINPWKKDAKK